MMPPAIHACLMWSLMFATVACSCSDPNERRGQATPTAGVLVGQLLLPEGNGSRGVEVRISAATEDAEITWVLFDDRGHFTHPFTSGLSQVIVTAGAVVHQIDASDLPRANLEGRIDFGVIDLRAQLTEHRLFVRAAEGSAAGDVRVGMWFGPPPVGPFGEPVSLGSRQFPPVALGSETAWLMPNDAHSIYFVVERPSGFDGEPQWLGGHQRQFGPFAAARLPAELVMD